MNAERMHQPQFDVSVGREQGIVANLDGPAYKVVEEAVAAVREQVFSETGLEITATAFLNAPGCNPSVPEEVVIRCGPPSASPARLVSLRSQAGRAEEQYWQAVRQRMPAYKIQNRRGQWQSAASRLLDGLGFIDIGLQEDHRNLPTPPKPIKRANTEAQSLTTSATVQRQEGAELKRKSKVGSVIGRGVLTAVTTLAGVPGEKQQDYVDPNQHPTVQNMQPMPVQADVVGAAREALAIASTQPLSEMMRINQIKDVIINAQAVKSVLPVADEKTGLALQTSKQEGPDIQVSATPEDLETNSRQTLKNDYYLTNDGTIGGMWYLVGNGDTIEIIRSWCGEETIAPTGQEILQINGLSSAEEITSGMRLKIPRVYVVKEGDTIESISLKIGLDKALFGGFNRISPKSSGGNLVVGQRLIFPEVMPNWAIPIELTGKIVIMPGFSSVQNQKLLKEIEQIEQVINLQPVLANYRMLGLAVKTLFKDRLPIYPVDSQARDFCIETFNEVKNAFYVGQGNVLPPGIYFNPLNMDVRALPHELNHLLQDYQGGALEEYNPDEIANLGILNTTIDWLP